MKKNKDIFLTLCVLKYISSLNLLKLFVGYYNWSCLLTLLYNFCRVKNGLKHRLTIAFRQGNVFPTFAFWSRSLNIEQIPSK